MLDDVTIVDEERTIDGEESNESKTFDLNDPSLLDEEVDQINPDAENEYIPPPDGIYTVNWDLAESDDLEKAFYVRQYKPKGKDNKASFLGTGLKGSIVACDDPNIEERLYINRPVRVQLTTIPFGESSSAADWLRSIGQKSVVIEASRARSKQEQLLIYKQGIIDAIVQGAQGKVATQWQASYKRSVLNSDGEMVDEYVRPGGKDAAGNKIGSKHPINRYKGEKSFPLEKKTLADGTEVQYRSPVAKFVDPDTNEKVEARANAEVKRFILGG